MSPFSPIITLSKVAHRRFILGRQGLWPGRRWRGLEGVATALTECEALQLDPLNIVARSHDIALYGRVLDYQPDYLYDVCYQQRRFFDYGGALFLYPMRELPYWRVAMSRDDVYSRWVTFRREHPETVAQVRQALAENGPLGNRDFTGNHRVNSYRGSKDTSIALYYLWLTGEAMIHHRDGFERVYDLHSRVAPAELDYTAPVDEAEAYFARKTIGFVGLARLVGWRAGVSDAINRKLTKSEGEAWMERLVDAGEVVAVRVEGDKDMRFALASDLPILETLQAGETPDAWQPLETSTLDEVTFLSPLEICSARGRAAKLFDFEYVWEVYKPVEQRRWGYYVLPILYSDRLVARMDSRLERATNMLRILGFWLEDPAPGYPLALGDDPAFAAAFKRGLHRFMQLAGAQSVVFPDNMPDTLCLEV